MLPCQRDDRMASCAGSFEVGTLEPYAVYRRVCFPNFLHSHVPETDLNIRDTGRMQGRSASSRTRQVVSFDLSASVLPFLTILPFFVAESWIKYSQELSSS